VRSSVLAAANRAAISADRPAGNRGAVQRGGLKLLYHLGYVSTQTRPLVRDDLSSLLDDALGRNQELDITGLLLHREGSFFQVLEGEKDDVLKIFDSIQRDPRHHRVKCLFEGEIEAREFPDWRMGFVELDGVDVGQLPGFSDFLDSGRPPRLLLEELSKAKRLMMLFRAMQ
jgi:hypothetical protein